MNERIKQLAEQAGYTDAYYESDDGPFVPAEFDKEKFAELIVRECVQLCQECIDDGCVEAQEPMGKIKKHFGVEE